eukprot:9484099-Pyramimonas_sp.AAC.1
MTDKLQRELRKARQSLVDNNKGRAIMEQQLLEAQGSAVESKVEEYSDNVVTRSERAEEEAIIQEALEGLQIQKRSVALNVCGLRNECQQLIYNVDCPVSERDAVQAQQQRHYLHKLLTDMSEHERPAQCRAPQAPAEGQVQVKAQAQPLRLRQGELAMQKSELETAEQREAPRSAM